MVQACCDGLVTCNRMNRSSAEPTAVLSCTCNNVELFWSTVVPLVVHPDRTSPVTSTKNDTSIAAEFFGAVIRKWPVLMSPTTGLFVATSGFNPSAYLSRLGMPSLVLMAVSAAAPLLAMVPKYCSRHNCIGISAVTKPDTAKSGALELPTSKMYQVPPEFVLPQFTMRNVTFVPGPTLCRSAKPPSAMAPNAAPLLELDGYVTFVMLLNAPEPI